MAHKKRPKLWCWTIKHLSWEYIKLDIYREQTFLDIYTKIHVNISYFNQDIRQNSAAGQNADLVNY